MRRMWFLLLLLCVFQPLQAALVAESVMSLRHELEQPSAVAVDENGMVFVLDGLQRRIQVFDAAGKPVNRLRLPPFPMPATDLALDGEKLYVADPSAHRILILDRRGKLLREAYPRADDQVVEPSALTIADRRLWWSDRRGHRLCRSLLDTEMSTSCTGFRGEEPGRFHYPYMLALDQSGYILVVDVLNARLQIFSPDGRHYGGMGHFGTGPGNLFRPNGLAVLEDGGVLVSDAWTGNITLFRQRRAESLLQRPDGQPWRFAMPVGMAAWRDRLYVVDLADNSVQVLRLLKEQVDVPPLALSAPEHDSRKNCMLCHPSWSSEYMPDPDAAVLPVADERMCLSCHHGAVVDSRTRLGRGHQHPTLHQIQDGKAAGDSTRFDKDKVPGDYPLSKDKHLYCGSCHTPHDKPEGGKALGQGRKNPWLRKANRDSALCIDCHASRHTPDGDRQRKDIPLLNHPIGIVMKPPPDQSARGYARTAELQQGLPDVLKKSGARLGDKDQIICQSCHQVHGAKNQPLLVTGENAGTLCVACHEHQHSRDEKQARSKGIHPVNLEMDEAVELGGRETKHVDCLTCHSVHEAEPGTALLPKEKNARNLCQTCHERQNAKDKDEALEKGVHPVNIRLDDPVKLAGKEIQELDCRTCHSVHEGVKGTPALVEEHADGKLCKTCHEEQQKIRDTDHDLRGHPPEHQNRLKETWNNAGLCGSCHSMHRGTGNEPFLFVGAEHPPAERQGMSSRDALCMSCHHQDNQMEAKAIKDYSHPWKDLVLRSDSGEMPLLDGKGRISEFGRIGCITCHEPHHWQPGEKPPEQERKDAAGNTEGTVQNSFLRRRDAAGSFCTDCHGREAKYKYKYFHDRVGREKALDYLH